MSVCCLQIAFHANSVPHFVHICRCLHNRRVAVPYQHSPSQIAAGTLGDNSQLNRRGDITFAYNNQANANVVNTGHGTMQVNDANNAVSLSQNTLLNNMLASEMPLFKHHNFRTNFQCMGQVSGQYGMPYCPAQTGFHFASPF